MSEFFPPLVVWWETTTTVCVEAGTGEKQIVHRHLDDEEPGRMIESWTPARSILREAWRVTSPLANGLGRRDKGS